MIEQRPKVWQFVVFKWLITADLITYTLGMIMKSLLRITWQSQGEQRYHTNVPGQYSQRTTYTPNIASSKQARKQISLLTSYGEVCPNNKQWLPPISQLCTIHLYRMNTALNFYSGDIYRYQPDHKVTSDFSHYIPISLMYGVIGYCIELWNWPVIERNNCQLTEGI